MPPADRLIHQSLTLAFRVAVPPLLVHEPEDPLDRLLTGPTDIQHGPKFFERVPLFLDRPFFIVNRTPVECRGRFPKQTPGLDVRCFGDDQSFDGGDVRPVARQLGIFKCCFRVFGDAELFPKACSVTVHDGSPGPGTAVPVASTVGVEAPDSAKTASPHRAANRLTLLIFGPYRTPRIIESKGRVLPRNH